MANIRQQRIQESYGRWRAMGPVDRQTLEAAFTRQFLAHHGDFTIDSPLILESATEDPHSKEELEDEKPLQRSSP